MEYCYSGMENCDVEVEIVINVIRKGICGADCPSQPTLVNPSRKQKCSSPFGFDLKLWIVHRCIYMKSALVVMWTSRMVVYKEDCFLQIVKCVSF